MALFDPGIGTQCQVAATKEAMEEEPCLENAADAAFFFVVAMAEVCRSYVGLP